ncbi:MAG: hypothetical protein GXO46_11775 [Chlorobi bacterium]|uniref:Uncharacterized protein n=1 Tax=Chryseobacterium gambrini TaxID=373672 RepID=A0AAJ1R460_9FLAO|nr:MULTISPECIES: hypothetical protein [Chryseobacterium]MDN4012932.1 hypothetical protein [Chryseobacterium gambrini]MDN4030790.1 hypothetical protein [Chryseobacterium gambrini]NPA09657.1 hypothetical protein [Chlorobiota bacterium]QWA38605.1 hypothetical protein KKI44_22520 [Chryseobacterium sp. ZHDP1]
MKKTLEFPKTIRFLNEDEIPNNPSILKRWEESKTANIVQGYTFKLKENNSENESIGFDFFAEINIDNSNLWNLIVALSKTLPEVAAVLFGHIDFDLNYGNYEEKDSILKFINQYKKELTQDAFINFGLIYNDDENLVEIFIDESKYIKYWGVDEELFRKIMNDFKLEEIENLEFIDEYPKVREALTRFDENAIDSNLLIEKLSEKYL